MVKYLMLAEKPEKRGVFFSRAAKMARFDAKHQISSVGKAPGDGSPRSEHPAPGPPSAGLLDFSINVNPLGPPHCLETVLADAVKLASICPEHDRRAVAALARAHDVEQETVVVGNGATSLLYQAVRALRPEKTLILAPSCPEYVRAAFLAGSHVEFKFAEARKMFRHNLAEMRDVSSYDLVIMANPNDPTGTFITPDEIWEWAAENPGTFFLVDEGFIDFMSGAHASVIGINCPNLIVLKSMSNFFAIPGLRLGMLWADPEVTGLLEGGWEPRRMNAFSQQIATMLYDERGYITTTHRLITKERSFITHGLTELGLRVFDSPVNFLMARIERKGITLDRLREPLLKRKVFIAGCSHFEGLDNRYVRVAVRRHHENERLLEALEQALNESVEQDGKA